MIPKEKRGPLARLPAMIRWLVTRLRRHNQPLFTFRPCSRRAGGGGPRVHGHAANYTMSPEYQTWHNMLSRCRNPNLPNYKNWGGRGIKVCKRWRNFLNFLADLGPKPPGLTIERIDNEKGYFPANVRWATYKEQANNTRRNRRPRKAVRAFSQVNSQP